MKNNNNKSNLFQRLNKFLELNNPYDDYEDDFDDEPFYKRNLKSNVKDKLFTDEKLTFEEFTTLLEIVTDKFKDCFSSKYGKYQDNNEFFHLLLPFWRCAKISIKFALKLGVV